MVLRYYAHPASEKREVWRDLSAEIITGWEIYPESILGYKGGNLGIHFQTRHLPKMSGIDNRCGVHPPISSILNYNEVMDYLKKNFSHLGSGVGGVASSSIAPKGDTVREEKKITFGTRLRKLFN